MNNLLEKIEDLYYSLRYRIYCFRVVAVQYVKNLLFSSEIRVNDIYTDCSYHPVKCTLSWGDDLEGISLIDGSSPRCCSRMCCGPRKISQKEADQLIEAFKKDGERGLMRLNGWSEEAIEKFMKEWRDEK
jgi:hypothetical protein